MIMLGGFDTYVKVYNTVPYKTYACIDEWSLQVLDVNGLSLVYSVWLVSMELWQGIEKCMFGYLSSNLRRVQRRTW